MNKKYLFLCMLSLTEENYLKNILILSESNEGVSVNALSNELGVKMPTVNSMVKKLAEKKYVVFESYKPIYLTNLGKKEAAFILRKHRLTETFLYKKMELGWEQVHPIAEQIEHIQSELFFDKMDELLGHPSIDPHGEPIPTKEGKIIRHHYAKLSSCNVNAEVVFSSVADVSESFLEYLNKRSLKLGMHLKILLKEPYDNSITIAYDGNKKEILSKVVCDKILVSTH